MKFKQQEETQEQPKENNLLKQTCKLLELNREFKYALDSYKDHDEYEYGLIGDKLNAQVNSLIKLCIALDEKHEYPTINPNCKPVTSINDLTKFEEEYYSSVISLGKIGLDESNIEVVAFTSDIITTFKHYFCKLDNESDSTL